MRPRVVLRRGDPQLPDQHREGVLEVDLLDRQVLLPEHLLQHAAREVLTVGQARIGCRMRAGAAGAAEGELPGRLVHVLALAAMRDVAAGAKLEAAGQDGRQAGEDLGGVQGHARPSRR